MRILESLYEHWTEYILERNLDMNVNDELEKFRQRKAQEFFTKELPERLKGFEAALEGTPEEIERKLEDQKEIYILNFWNKLDELEEQKKKSLELAEKTENIYCEDEEKPLSSEIIADQDAEIKKLKEELLKARNDAKAFEEDWQYVLDQRDLLRAQLDIITFTLKFYDFGCLENVQNVVRAMYELQPPKEEDEQEGEHNEKV